MRSLPMKCEHFNMYAFALPLAQMSENDNVSTSMLVNKQLADLRSLVQV